MAQCLLRNLESTYWIFRGNILIELNGNGHQLLFSVQEEQRYRCTNLKTSADILNPQKKKKKKKKRNTKEATNSFSICLKSTYWPVIPGRQIFEDFVIHNEESFGINDLFDGPTFQKWSKHLCGHSHAAKK